MPDLPRGTVAFLFTDIEGSTRLWERDAAAMQRALERHNAILGEAISASRGVHFKTIGDAFQAVFPTVSLAVTAAVAAQRELAAEAWPETGAIRVRMAIHVGDATPVSGDRPDYLAPALNRLARLLAAGHGGQTLLTNAARILSAESLPEGIALRDLGRHQLRDLLEAEHVWQLAIPGLPGTFPALKTLERHPTNLPPQPASLVGRDALLTKLTPVIGDTATRLLTLTGPGGVGKTRLAVHLAANALDEFPDGAYFVDLSGVASSEQALPAIAAVLGAREGGGLSQKEATIALLAPKRLLLVLDNLEQIRPAGVLGREIAELLGAAPTLTILATSRAPLRIRFEREWPLDPLPAPDPEKPLPAVVLAENPAVALFVERARAARPSFDLDDGNARVVAEIVHMLDGLPLALELAAARLRALSAVQLRDRLGSRLDLLFGGTHDRPERHQTLRATIDWSHNLLSPAQQAFFRRLSVFSGGFTLDATESIAAVTGASTIDVVDGIDELLAESLVRTEETAAGDLRYRMLETIRAFADERLNASGEADTVRAVHLEYFTTWSESTAAGLKDKQRATTLDLFEVEYPNLRAALTWTSGRDQPDAGLRLAKAIWKFWQYRAYFSEGRDWLHRLLDATRDEPTEERMVGFEAAGVLAWNQGDLASAQQLLQRALTIADARGDAAARGRCLNNLGNVLNLKGDLDGAADLFSQSLALARAAGEEHQVGIILNNLALIQMDRGELDDARGMLEESLRIKNRLGIRAEIAIVLGNLALIAWLNRDLPRAAALLEEGLAIEREIGNPVGIADALGNLGQILVETGALQRAIPLHRESLTLRRDIGDWLSIPYSLEAIGMAAVVEGRHAEAVPLFSASSCLRDETGAPIPQTDRMQYDAMLSSARRALGEEGFARRWQDGCLLRREEAIDAALALCDHLDGSGDGYTITEGAPALADAALAPAATA